MEAKELFCREIVDSFCEPDNETDTLLAAASMEYEESVRTTSHTLPAPTTTTGSNAYSLPETQPHPKRFALPQTEDDILRGRDAGIPETTKKDTRYCVSIWDAWSKEREQTTHTHIPSLSTMTVAQLSHWMTRFVLEARKKNGDPYPPNSLHHIVTGLMRHLRWSGRVIDFFKDSNFIEFRASLDSEMKRLQSTGLGSVKRQAEVITEEDEETLWRKGLLGDHTPQVLLDSIVYYCGLHFALRSGKEHRQLRHFPCQIELVETAGQRSFLRYTEDQSKNHQGGLRARKVKHKVVIQHENTEDPKHCFVRLFKRYRQLCPANTPSHAFYLQPSRRPTSSCWYSNRPLGHTTLSKTISRICKRAGISGYKTNHSLRATSTTRLYQSGVDEQLVMERTGHRSIEGVRSYKRTSDSQREVLSNILNRQTQVAAPVPSPVTPHPGLHQHLSQSTHSHQLLHGLSLPSATFNNCTVNFNIGSVPGPSGETEMPRKRRRAIIQDSDSE